MTDDDDIILFVRDRGGATSDQVLYDPTSQTTPEVLRPLVAKDAVLGSDGYNAYAAFAHAEYILLIPIITSRGSTSTADSTSWM